MPDFVLQFVQRLEPAAGAVTVIAPHAAGAKHREAFGNITVRRFRYAYPYKYENLTYGQAAKRTLMYRLRGVCYVIAEFWATFWVCVRRRPAIINAHWLIPQGFVGLLAGRLFGARVVVTIHGQDATFKLGGNMGRLVLAVKRFVLKHADAVVVNSTANQALCQKIWPEREYPIIPMGVDATRFAERPKHKKGDIFEVLFVGRLAEVKGVIYLCQAMKLLQKKRKDTHLTVVGDGPERPALESFVLENSLEDVIAFAGWVQPTELPQYYANADVFAGPSIRDSASRIEAFGLVFAEASAAGLPVVTTNVGGVTDIVKDGETGLVVPQKDSQALYEALEYLYTHRTRGKEMGRRGQKFVTENFSWEAITKRYLDLFASLIERA